MNADAIRVADVVLIPCKPRVWDAWACEDIVAAVKLRQDANRGWPNGPLSSSLWGAPERVSASRLVQPTAELGDCPYISRATTERESYAVAAGEGQSSAGTAGTRVAKDEISRHLRRDHGDV